MNCKIYRSARHLLITLEAFMAWKIPSFNCEWLIIRFIECCYLFKVLLGIYRQMSVGNLYIARWSLFSSIVRFYFFFLSLSLWLLCSHFYFNFIACFAMECLWSSLTTCKIGYSDYDCIRVMRRQWGTSWRKHWPHIYEYCGGSGRYLLHAGSSKHI